MKIMKDIFKNKKLLITGGTGSFGNAVLEKFIHSNIKEITIFSRDEKKQDDLRRKHNSSKIKFYIGDIRDKDSLISVTRGIDFIFHAAALKQVPSCEFFPMEAVKTNVIGTENLLEAAILNNVKKVICLSTDKAVYPINAMGISKGMMEKVLVSKSRNSNKTLIIGTRYGNVLASRGSVVPLFDEQINKKIPITITDPKMTRFIMSLEDAVELVLYAFENGKGGDIFVQKAPASTILDLCNSIKRLKGEVDYKVKIIGTRHGEKLHETLCSREEMLVAEDLGNYFRIPSDNRDLNYPAFFDKGDKRMSQMEDFNSSNTNQLNADELDKILKEQYFSKIL
jgi:UDP-glucose 4-epimerase